jgi:hypothetical protein
VWSNELREVTQLVAEQQAQTVLGYVSEESWGGFAVSSGSVAEVAPLGKI